MNSQGNFELYFFNHDDTICQISNKFEKTYFNDFENDVVYLEVDENRVSPDGLKDETEQHFVKVFQMGAVHHHLYIFKQRAYECVFSRTLDFKSFEDVILQRQLLEYNRVLLGHEVTVDDSISLNTQFPSRNNWFRSGIFLSPGRKLKEIQKEFFSLCNIDLDCKLV